MEGDMNPTTLLATRAELIAILFNTVIGNPPKVSSLRS
ncbi:hypothetical protein FHT97_005924 [Rhizobium sp. BK399]|nr:hypothetical protein [Rhizobium sp. BK181]MBB3545154.1 hypothetical protein [Rhizobium sp. BK399]MCS3743913.1 hypothetical protein [Rhizobium sp. BK661]